MILFVPILMIITALNPVLNFQQLSSSKIYELKSYDHELANYGEFSSLLNTYTARLNILLDLAYIGCPIALATATLPELKLLTKIIKWTQNIMLLLVKLYTTYMDLFYQVDYLSPKRGPVQSPCVLPGLIEWKEGRIIVVQNSASGIVGHFSKKYLFQWYYQNEKVRIL